jgi:serine/threonine protein kinase
VAIKVLPKDFAADADRLRRFEHEAKALASLNHPGILTIHDAGVHEGTPYLVSELLRGHTLREEMSGGALPVRKATEFASQIAQGLAAANGKGAIHRDLKPENIFVTTDGRVKILDFGLAKLRSPEPPEGEKKAGAKGRAATIRIDPDAIINTTAPGMVLGTPAYMSPEQVRGEPADHRADIFAFGCVLYEMLSGTRAFRRNTPVESMSAVLNEALPELSTTHPNIPLPLARIVERCLEKEPNNRFQSASDLAFALSALAVGSSAARSPTGEPVAVRPAVKRFALPALAAVLAVSLAVVSVGWWQTTRTPGRASQIRSLAVLPFTFETQDPKVAGLGKWIPAEIRSKLGPLQNLQVVNSPARIEQLVQQKKSEVEIARELGVDGLVMGELHGQGETMSAYVWVVDGSTGRALGRQREIASAASKVSELPNQVALAIVDELKLQVSTSQRTEIQAADTQNAEAFLAYQKGSELLSRRLNAEAAVEFRQAYQLDTNYTRAWTGLANSEWVPLIFGGTTNEMAATFKRLSAEAERFRGQLQATAVPALSFGLPRPRIHGKERISMQGLSTVT